MACLGLASSPVWADCVGLSSNRRFRDTSCDGVKDAGERFLDESEAATGDSATAFFATGEIADAQISDTLTLGASATASTAAANDNDTSPATTAYAQTELTAYASDTVTFTAKTLDGEGTGNVITLTSVIPLRPATCQNATATLNWDHETTNFPAATCVTGSNTQKAYAYFNDTTDQCLQTTLQLPDDWTGAVDVTYMWLAASTTSSVAWCTQLICVADAETDDPAFPAQAAGNCVTDAAKGTTLQLNTVTDTGITATGCAAGEQMHIRTCRDPNETGAQTDAMTGDARLADVLLKIRRAQ